MADISKDSLLITVHGRDSLSVPYTRYGKSAVGRETQIDIRNSIIYFEIPAAGIRKQLAVNAADAKGLLIQLTRTEVEKIPLEPTPFAVVDETVTAYPKVEWTGKIQRTGYVGAPTP